jgi:hypothetical protein
MLNIIIPKSKQLHKQLRYLNLIVDGELDGRLKYDDWSKEFDEKHAGKYNLSQYDTPIFGPIVKILHDPDMFDNRGLKPLLLEHNNVIVLIGIDAKNWENEIDDVIITLVTFSSYSDNRILIIENDEINNELNLKIVKELSDKLKNEHYGISPVINFVPISLNGFDNIINFTDYTEWLYPKTHINKLIVDKYGSIQDNKFNGKIMEMYKDKNHIFPVIMMESGTVFDTDDIVLLPSQTVIKKEEYSIEHNHNLKSYIRTNDKSIIVINNNDNVNYDTIKNDLCISNYNADGKYPMPTKMFQFNGIVILNNELDKYGYDISSCKHVRCDYNTQTKNGSFMAELCTFNKLEKMKFGQRTELWLRPKSCIYLTSRNTNEYHSRITLWLMTDDTHESSAYYRIHGHIIRI